MPSKYSNTGKVASGGVQVKGTLQQAPGNLQSSQSILSQLLEESMAETKHWNDSSVGSQVKLLKETKKRLSNGKTEKLGLKRELSDEKSGARKDPTGNSSGGEQLGINTIELDELIQSEAQKFERDEAYRTGDPPIDHSPEIILEAGEMEEVDSPSAKKLAHQFPRGVNESNRPDESPKKKLVNMQSHLVETDEKKQIGRFNHEYQSDMGGKVSPVQHSTLKEDQTNLHAQPQDPHGSIAERKSDVKGASKIHEFQKRSGKGSKSQISGDTNTTKETLHQQNLHSRKIGKQPEAPSTVSSSSPNHITSGAVGLKKSNFGPDMVFGGKGS
jgi:hypothetical protein